MSRISMEDGEYNHSYAEPVLDRPRLYSSNVKGFCYERLVWTMLDRNNIPNVHNPEVFYEWKKVRRHPYDILVDNYKIECKFLAKKVYRSWIERDWLTRDCDLIVTSNKWLISQEDRELIKSRGIRLLDTYQFLWYILHSYGNRYNLNKLRYRHDQNSKLDPGHRLNSVTVSCNCILLGSEPVLSSSNCFGSGHKTESGRKNLQPPSWFFPALHYRDLLPAITLDTCLETPIFHLEHSHLCSSHAPLLLFGVEGLPSETEPDKTTNIGDTHV